MDNFNIVGYILEHMLLFAAIGAFCGWFIVFGYDIISEYLYEKKNQAEEKAWKKHREEEAASKGLTLEQMEKQELQAEIEAGTLWDSPAHSETFIKEAQELGISIQELEEKKIKEQYCSGGG